MERYVYRKEMTKMIRYTVTTVVVWEIIFVDKKYGLEEPSNTRCRNYLPRYGGK